MNFFVLIVFLMMINYNNFILKIMNYQSFWLIILMFMIILVCFFNNQKFFNIFYFIFLMIICYLFFSSFLWILLFFSFELVLLPIIFMVLLNGSQIEKIIASNYFIFYSSFFSLPFIVFILNSKFSFSLIMLKIKMNNFYFYLMMLVFLMKIPLFILHFWLPKVHVEASTEASMILAGLLLKLGTYGLSLLMKMLTKSFLMLLWFFALVGFTLMNLITLFQSDMKSFLALSSVVHMNFVIINFCILTKISKLSSFYLILGHGFVSTLMFWLIGEIYKMNMVRLFYFMKSLFFSNWKFFVFLMVFYLMNLGVPLSISFFSELLGFFSMMKMSNFSYIIIFNYFIWSFLFSFIMMLNHYVGKKKMLIKDKNMVSLFSFWIISFFVVLYF